jgi:hypothetical protein
MSRMFEQSLTVMYSAPCGSEESTFWALALTTWLLSPIMCIWNCFFNLLVLAWS